MQITYFKEIEDYFLSSISDYTLLTKSDKEISDDVQLYFKKARATFYKCKKPLGLLADEDGNQFFGYKEMIKIENQEVESTVGVYVDDFEISIIVHLMLVEYMKPVLISTEVIKQSLSDKDFKIYSQANQLRELNLLYRHLRRESKKMMTEYSYRGLIEDDKK